MRICIDGRLARQHGGTGVSSYGKGLANTVAALGHLVEPLVDGGKSGRASAWLGAVRPGEWRVPLTDGRRSGGTVFRSAQIRFDLRRTLLPVCDTADPPALMHWTYPLPLRFAAVPNLYTIHDLIPLLHPGLSPISDKRMRRLLGCVTEAATHIVTVSECSRREIIDVLGVPPDRVTNTYQAIVDTRPNPAALAQTLNVLGLTPGGYVLHAGSVEPRKNVRRLIQAHRESRSRWPLVIAGPDGWRAATELANAGPEVIRLPWVARADLVALIAGARCVLVPSLAEGFGLVVAEAMTLGTAVICSAHGALREVAGDAAQLVDAEDTAAWTAMLASLDRDDDAISALVAAGNLRAQNFTLAAHADRLQPLYARLSAAV